MLVRPPSLLPGDGLSLKLPAKRVKYCLQPWTKLNSFSATCRLRARRTNRCSAPKISVVSASTAVAPISASISEQTPSAGFAVMPENESEPPQFSPVSFGHDQHSVNGTARRLRADLLPGVQRQALRRVRFPKIAALRISVLKGARIHIGRAGCAEGQSAHANRRPLVAQWNSRPAGILGDGPDPAFIARHQ